MQHSSVTIRRQLAFLGASPWSKHLREQIECLAAYDSTVIITGPTGTGKEVIAHSLHQQSSRAEGPFIPVDCTTFSGPMFASQLFGHRRGAFTGADYDALGSFRAAEGGTIFLDEIGEIGPNLQAMLLRVIQERSVLPLGVHQPIPVNVRIMAATNRDLKQDVASGRFREDLYFRLNVASLETVPLKQRLDDIPVLAEHFLEQLAVLGGLPRKRLSPGALEQLAMYSWPGNVRELRHFLERAVITTAGDVISLPVVQPLLEQTRMPRVDNVARGIWVAEEDEAPAVTKAASRVRSESEERRPLSSQSADTGSHTEKSASWTTMAKLEREHIICTLEHTFYNQSAAARLLDINRQALIRKIKLYNIETVSAPAKPRV